MTVVPDGIEPVVAYRSWGFNNGLYSEHGGQPWRPGEPCEAECPHAFWEWLAVQEDGLTLEEIKKTYKPQYAQVYAQSAYHAVPSMSSGFGPQQLPNVTLPEGWGYRSVVHSHLAPDEHCTCGIYGATSPMGATSKYVRGEVYLWGKVIQGAKAHRAQYAYPKRIWTYDEKLVEALETYGVPVKVRKKKPSSRQAKEDAIVKQMMLQQQLYGNSMTKVDWLEDQVVPRFTNTNTTNTDLLSLHWQNVNPLS